jgi:thioredoxin reductase
VEELTDRPFPPGRYPVVIVGSGPGGLQLSYSLDRRGVGRATISADPGPGGMFRRWPLMQRMLSWTKPHAPQPRQSRGYERYDWNSLVPEEDELRGIQAEFMDRTSYFPSRPDMERALVAFAERSGTAVRYRCRWESTRREGEDFVVVTSDGEYRTSVVVIAVGVAEPWRPSSPGLDLVPHYGEMRGVDEYVGKRVFIIGKKNSGFEIANALLPVAEQIILGSPSPARLSVETKSLVGVRARYVQPFEDQCLGGGVFIIDAAIDSVARTGATHRVETHRSDTGKPMTFEVDEVIAATGFVAPLLDLPELGVSTFGQSRLPAQTPYWESSSLPGIYFAGTISQGSAGLKKHGIPSNSGAVHGHRYNAMVLARHLAEARFGVPIETPRLDPAGLSEWLLNEVTFGPEVWHQRSYLARAVSITTGAGVRDEGFLPLAQFVDEGPADAVAITAEADGSGAIYPAVYVRRDGRLSEHLLTPNQLLDYRLPEYRRELDLALQPLLGGAGS